MMKAVIIAAGKGTRMLPLTEKTPKVLIEVNKKPFLYYMIKHLQDIGISEIGIIVGHLKDEFPKFLDKYGFKAELIEQDEAKGTGHAAKLAKEFVGGNNFLLIYGDNLWSAADLKRICQDDNLQYISGIKVEDPQKYGVLKVKDGKLLEVVEKPGKFIGDLINTGLYKFTPEIFEALEKIKLSPRGEYELTDAVNLLAKEGKVNAVSINDYWLDLGSKDDIQKVGKFLKAMGE